MTDNEMRIAIAEECGWKKHREIEPGHWVWELPPTRALWGQTKIPDYLNDLNAMHEAEKTIAYKDELFESYQENLLKVVLSQYGYQGASFLIVATSRQRAEAFLRTVGKWK